MRVLAGYNSPDISCEKRMPIPPKALADDFLGRFREIVSDPLNLLIERDPMAGFVDGGMVCLHNGIYVPLAGDGAYFGDFSQILVINRGVHEPLEEFVFQELIKLLPDSPVSLELGAYWAHYSMWLKQSRPQGFPILLEADETHLRAGVENFRRNNFAGEFIQAFVGPGQFEVDAFLASRPGLRLDVLHSDIDLHEMSMLRGAANSLQSRAVDYVLISTHSQDLHHQVVEEMRSHEYRVEVSCDFDHESTSFDGFVLASSPNVRPVFSQQMNFLGRTAVVQSGPTALVASLQQR
jgi:hypothetical protein